MGLFGGLTLQEMSARDHLSVNTVRVQLVNIFAKTGVHRQVELVRLLTSSAPV